MATIVSRGTVRFAELFETAANRGEVVCTFLALLELIRLKQLACIQPEPFAEIEISRAPQIVAAAEAAPSEAAETAQPAEAAEAAEPTATAEPAPPVDPPAAVEPPPLS